MTYKVSQLYEKQKQENEIVIRSVQEKNTANEKEVKMAIGDVREYRNEITLLQNQLQELQLAYSKLLIKNQIPTGDIRESIVKLDMSKCTGCSACYNSCPVNAIIMKENENGFIVPEVVREKCRNCGYCSAVCPQLNLRLRNSEKTVCLAVMASDDFRIVSSSGGVFPVLAEYVLDRDGYVCGAVWTENWEVEHQIIDSRMDISKIQESKYVQSNINKIYVQIERLLKNNQYVLFTGTPCQVDGLNHYLKKEYEKLITMDILCHGVPSQKAFESYLSSKYEGRKIKRILFRDKRVNGWGAYTTIEFEDGYKIQMNLQNCMWIMNYLRFNMNRDSCYECPYTSTRRVGDFTVGDFWGIEKYYPAFTDGKGTSVLTLNNQKAIEIYNQINTCFKLKEWLPIEYSIERNSSWIKKTKMPIERQIFLESMKTKNYCEAAEDAMYHNKTYDIGVVGWWYYYNYGSILTYFALNRALVRMGYSVLMIHHSNNGNKMSNLTGCFPETFIKKYCNISHFYTSEDMHLLNNRCRAFISGSDQLWNPYCEGAAGKEFFLDFADDEHLKLTYAASLGNTMEANDEFKDKYAPLAQRFAGVSVRENSGIEGCKTIYGIEAVKVCDPVFLCEKSEFENLAQKSKLNLKEKNIC